MSCKERCKNGTCLNFGDSRNLVCTCEEGWKGENCDIPINNCKETCENGKCLNFGDSNNLVCTCNPGFRGKNCDENDLCYYEHGGGKLKKKRCDHGTCNPYSGRCVCEPGYSGYFCEKDACEAVDGDMYCHFKGKCVVDPVTHKPTCECHIGNYFGERCNEHCPLDTYWSPSDLKCTPCAVKHNDPRRYQYCDGSWEKDVSSAYSEILYCNSDDCYIHFANADCTFANPKACPDGYKPAGRDSHGLHWESSRGYNPGNPCYFGSDLRRCKFDHRPRQT